MKKLLLISALALLSAGCSLPKSTQDKCNGRYDSTITVSSHTLCVQLVSSTTELAQGLSSRPSMEKNEGMFFVISGKPAFWMKDMNFDLDLIWVKEGHIVAINKSVPYPRNADENQNEKLPTYSPPSEIDHVLEVNAGWSDENKITVGDEIKF